MNIYKTNITSHSTLIFCVLATVVLFGIWGTYIAKNAEAADGIFGQINFQGKLVGADGTNVTDGNYSITFTLYDASSGGTNLWDETQTVSVTDGIFRVSLGAIDSTIADVNFNTDNLYLGIQVESDDEMTPRVRFTAVPYAFNAEKVNGLTVTNTSDNPFATATTLKIGDGKTVQIDNGLRFTGTDGTQFTFPNASGTVVTLDSSGTLTNKTIGSTGLVFSGATTDITTGADEILSLTPNGNGYVNINPVAGGYAALVIDKLGNGDIFTASSSGVPRFSVTGAGGIRLGTSVGTSGNCLLSGGAGGAATWGACSPTDSIGFTINSSLGVTIQKNTTTDLLIGGTASSSAKFGFLNVNSGDPTFTIRNSSGNNPATLSVSTDGDLTIAATLDVIVGSGTGDINILPGSDDAIVNLESTGDFMIQDDGDTYAVFTDDGNIGIGTTSPIGKFHLEGDNPGTTALVRINALAGSSADLFTASASGTPIFTITNLGEIRLGTDIGTSDECLKSGGAGNPIIWGACGTGGEIGGSWTTAQGAVFPNQATSLDVLVGGTATSSAKFGVLGIESGTPTASVSAQNVDGNALILRSTGIIETANKGALQIGSTDTGDIILSAQGSGTGLVRINGSSTTPDLLVLGSKTTAGDPTGLSGALYMNSSNKLMVNEGGTWKEVCNKIDLACGTGSGAAWSALTAPSNNLGLSMSAWTSTFTYNATTGANNLWTLVDSTNNTGTGYMMSLQTASGSNAKPFRAVTRGNAVIDTTTTGGVILGSNFGNGNILIQPNAGGQAALTINKQGLNDIFTASSSGTTRFVISSNGNVGIGTTLPTAGLHLSRDTGHRAAAVFDATGGITTSDIFTASSSGTTRFSVTRAGGIKLGTSVGTLGNCLLSGGSGGASTWGACASVFTQISGLGQSNGGITFLGNTTTDFLLGGTASSSAKFAVLGMNNGSTPTASVSATSTGNAVFLSGDGSIQTVRRRNLTIGGSSTGAIQFGPNNTTTMTLSNGNVGIGTSIPGARLNVQSASVGKALVILNETGAGNDILAASSSGTTRFVVNNSGNVGIGLSNPTAGKFVISDSSSAPGVDLQRITATTGATATGVDGLQIDFATAGTTASADNAGLRINVTSNNSGAGTTLEGIYIGNLSSAEANASEYGLRVGTGWDVGVLVESGGIQVAGGSISYSSGNRPARKIVISPEYPGAVLFGDGSNNTGSMTSDYVSSGDRQTYYEWSSSQGVIQDYTIVVRFTIPDNFSAWDTTPLVFDYVTESTSASNNQVDISVYLEGGSVDATDNDNVSASAGTWTTTSGITSADLGDCNAAGETCVVEFLMQSVSDNYVRVGDITLNYLANF